MASNNTIKDDVLLLFPDNLNKEISAEDMRIYVDAVFDDKEVVVTKVATASDIKANNARIYEHSIVLIYADGDNVGVYLSLVNQPISILQLKKLAGISNGGGGGNLYSDGSVPMDAGYVPLNDLDIATKGFVSASSSGNPYPPNTPEHFLFTYNSVKVASEATYSYVSGDIDTINVIQNALTKYTVGLEYNVDGDISTQTITDDIGVYCTITYAYLAGIITDKTYILTNP